MARVLVLDGHSAAALALTRSLGRAGHWVAVGANRDIFAAASRSRYCRVSFQHPVSTDDAGAFTSAVLDFVRKNGIELVIPVSDWTTLPLSRHRDELNGVCRVALPSPEALELTADKYATIELARSLDVPVPDTRLIRLPLDLESLPAFKYPVVVKDRFSLRWVGSRSVLGSATYAFSYGDLRRQVEDRLRQAGDVLLQSFVSGVGIGFAGFAVDGDIRLPFQWRRIRETDPRGSGSSCRKSVALDPQIVESSAKLLTRAGFQGIAMVEYKQDLADGRAVLMEVNGRPWGSIQLAIASGMDYPRHWVDWLLEGKSPPQEIAYKKGITCRRMVGELTHLQHLRYGPPEGWPRPYPNFWTSLMKIGVPWYPGMCYDDLSLSDPRPGLAEISNWFHVRWRSQARKPSG